MSLWTSSKEAETHIYFDVTQQWDLFLEMTENKNPIKRFEISNHNPLLFPHSVVLIKSQV